VTIYKKINENKPEYLYKLILSFMPESIGDYKIYPGFVLSYNDDYNITYSKFITEYECYNIQINITKLYGINVELSYVDEDGNETWSECEGYYSDLTEKHFEDFLILAKKFENKKKKKKKKKEI
jgi:hypothetical protein